MFLKLLPWSWLGVMLLASCAVLDPQAESTEKKAVVTGAVLSGPTAKSGAETAPPASPAKLGVTAVTPQQPGAQPDGAKLYPGTGNLVKQAPVTPPSVAGPEEVVLNFEGVDIRTIIETILSNYLREPYLLHPSVSGTATLRTTRGIPRKELVPTLELLLRQNGQALVREDGLYKIIPFSQVRGSITPQLGGPATPLPSGFSVLVVPLKYTGAKAMEQILQPFVTDASAVRSDEIRNMVVLAGGQRELKHLLETIDLFDVDFLSGMSVGLFPIRSVDVKGLVAEIEKVFGITPNNPLTGIVRILPIERLNSLLVVTPQPRYLEEAKKWIERLDRTTQTGGGLHVYQVKNGKAENLASLLSEIFGGKSGSSSAIPALAPGARPAEIRSPSTPGAPATSQPASANVAPFSGDGVLVSKDVRVVADKDNNALLIIASQADYEKIEQALSRLDVVPRQVLVEVMIAEVSLTDELRFGIDWFINARAGTSNGIANIANNITTGTSNFGGSLPASPSGTPSAFSGLQLINTLNGDIRGVLRAFGRDGKVQVLASPSIMVQDNQKASIKVGDRISVTTGNQTTGTSTGVIQTIQYLDTGVLLTVQPRINSSGQISMEVSQEVSTPGAAGVGGNPNVSTRSFQTSVTVNSGESMALAGLIQRNQTSGGSGLPLISKIPVLGAAFGTQNISDNKTELVVVITPLVVANAAQAQQVTNELKRKLPSLESLLKAQSATKAEKPAASR